MASAPLNWLLKIGGATLKTTAKTLSEAVNTLHDTVTNLSTTVTNLGTSKADASTTTTALNNLETNKLNISDLLSLEEIEASTSLTGKGVTAESIKALNSSLNEKGNIELLYTSDILTADKTVTLTNDLSKYQELIFVVTGTWISSVGTFFTYPIKCDFLRNLPLKNVPTHVVRCFWDANLLGNVSFKYTSDTSYSVGFGGNSTLKPQYFIYGVK